MAKLFFLFTSILAYFIQPVSVKDFEPAFGKWNGTLTYLDYTSGKPYTMPANMNISPDKSITQQLVFSIEYPDEPKANGNDTLVISTDGKMLNGAKVVSMKTVNEGLQIITEKEGVDGNESKKALLRHVYTIGKKEFSNRKEVKFQGEEKWVMRNEYKMTR
jgi:hypothetical protein